MPPRAWKVLPAIRQAAWRAFEVAFWLIVVVSAIGSFYDWITGVPRGPQAGDQCGPSHHWGYIRSGYDMELSCERDRD